jgi:hypothetical protein
VGRCGSLWVVVGRCGSFSYALIQSVVWMDGELYLIVFSRFDDSHWLSQWMFCCNLSYAQNVQNGIILVLKYKNTS